MTACSVAAVVIASHDNIARAVLLVDPTIDTALDINRAIDCVSRTIAREPRAPPLAQQYAPWLQTTAASCARSRFGSRGVWGRTRRGTAWICRTRSAVASTRRVADGRFGMLLSTRFWRWKGRLTACRGRRRVRLLVIGDIERTIIGIRATGDWAFAIGYAGADIVVVFFVFVVVQVDNGGGGGRGLGWVAGGSGACMQSRCQRSMSSSNRAGRGGGRRRLLTSRRRGRRACSFDAANWGERIPKLLGIACHVVPAPSMEVVVGPRPRLYELHGLVGVG